MEQFDESCDDGALDAELELDSDPEELWRSLIADEEYPRYWSESVWAHDPEDGSESAALLFADGAAETELSQEAVRPASAMDGSIQVAPPAEMRRRVSNLAAGTYINDILSEQDSTLFRWPDGLSNALRVYVEPTATAPNWRTR